MKTAKTELKDWGRSEYKRSDVGEIVRGKYANCIRESTNVVILEPEVVKAFPNDEAVNKALRGLISASPPATGPSLKRKPKKTTTTEKTGAA